MAYLNGQNPLVGAEIDKQAARIFGGTTKDQGYSALIDFMRNDREINEDDAKEGARATARAGGGDMRDKDEIEEWSAAMVEQLFGEDD